MPGQGWEWGLTSSPRQLFPHSMVEQEGRGREVVFANLGCFNNMPDGVALTTEIYFPEFWALASSRSRCCHSAPGEGVPAPRGTSSHG